MFFGPGGTPRFGVNTPLPHSAPNSLTSPFYKTPFPGFFGTPRGTGFINPNAYQDRKSTRLNSSHLVISYAVFCLKKKKSHADEVWVLQKNTHHSNSVPGHCYYDSPVYDYRYIHIVVALILGCTVIHICAFSLAS